MTRYTFTFEKNRSESIEWQESILDVIAYQGIARAEFIVQQLIETLRAQQSIAPLGNKTLLENSKELTQSTSYPQEESHIARKSANVIAWNAACMVAQASKRASELGGHIATYASIADLYDVALNYFCRGRSDKHLEDIVYFQGHSTPGIYSRAFLEGRLEQSQLENFRQETQGLGLSSYPHPWLMPDFWQFPTVSMGLASVQAIYQARFQKYLSNRSLLPDANRKVWAFMGDGEMDEVESLGAIRLPVRENLDNLIFVINCNLQRLDGLVNANDSIIGELEGMFTGTGWKTLKVIWNKAMDRLFEKDHDGYLRAKLSNLVDGDLQKLLAEDGQSMKAFFSEDPKLKQLVEGWTDDDFNQLGRGGHDAKAIYEAYDIASKHQGQPVVIFAMTTKGHGIEQVAGTYTAHNIKKMNESMLTSYASYLDIPISTKEAESAAFYHPGKDSEEARFVINKRKQLGGFLPRRFNDSPKLKTPDLEQFNVLLSGSGDREVSTTMVLVRMLGLLLRDKNIKDFLVPIVPDESRTFGMEGLFRQIGIYTPHGQTYVPVDDSSVMSYRESKTGQYLQEGVNEAGSMGSWMAAATSYSTNAVSLIPFYVYYSMFGFQRIGDFIWAAGDMRARGFLIGGTAGRTTLAGEGLQHNDGNSHHIATLVPNCISYDPTFGYELVVIIRSGIYRMFECQEDVFYYITVMNENYFHPEMPKGIEEDIIKGMYLLKEKEKACIHLLGSGTILREVIEAQSLLQSFDIDANVWSVTSFTELAREAALVERHNRVHIDQPAKKSFVEQQLGTDLPVVAATDYVAQYSQQIAPYLKTSMTCLGTDGYGRSDTRKALRTFHEVNAEMIAYTAMYELYQQGKITNEKLLEARNTFEIQLKDPQFEEIVAKTKVSE